MNIIDEEGKLRNQSWLQQNFGPVTIHTPTSTHQYEITELRANAGPAAIIARVLDTTGNPLPNILTVFHWPDAPALPRSGWHDAGVIGPTKQTGDVGHAMGGGAYYSPPTQGPHSLWIFGPYNSQMISGLGMIAGTSHRHLDVTFQDRTGSLPPPPFPPTPPPDLAELRHILQLIREARQVLVDYIATLET